MIDKTVSTGLVSVAALMAGSTAVSAQDHTGFYVGLSYGKTQGTSPIQPYFYDDEGYQADGKNLGAFGGYRWNVSDRIVMGAELAWQGSIYVDESAGEQGNSNDNYRLNNLIDAKLSVGTSLGKALVYGFAGASTVGLGTGSDDYSGATGANFGVGVDYQVSEKVSIGAEFISRNMTGYEHPATDGTPIQDRTNLNTVSLRASFKF